MNSPVLFTILCGLHYLNTVYAECEDKCGENCLLNADFVDGTYRITEPGIYCIGEDIVFNPRQPEDLSSPNGDMNNWMPGNREGDDVAYPGTLLNLMPGNLGGIVTKINGPFAGGFWAAITIETGNVELDLQGHSVSFHPYFYTQQRFGTIIEVQNTPYAELSKRSNGIWLWGPQNDIDDVWIHNGDLGLSPHHGIHSNSKASNVVIEDMSIHDFEVGGIQFNDFQNVVLRNIDIGPSATNVKLNGYYGAARYDLLSLFYTDGPADQEVIDFADGRTKTVEEVRNDLIAAMDIAFKYANDLLTDQDVASDIYEDAINLFINDNGDLPDGSTLYGVVFHSWLEASSGFGTEHQYFPNEDVDIQGVTIDNVVIHDLVKSTHEIPAIYMNKCFDNAEEWGSFLYSRYRLIDAVRSPLGPTMDLRLLIENGFDVIDSGLLVDKSNYAQYTKYAGNVYGDAMIALKMYGGFKSRLTSIIEDWATNSGTSSIDTLPECMNFVCDSDVIYQTNKGIIGVRMDDIDNININNLEIYNLDNQSPLASMACGAYSGPLNGGNHFQLDNEGAMIGDVRGVSLFNSEAAFSGQITVNQISSWYGNVYGMHIMEGSVVDFSDDTLMVNIGDLIPHNQLTTESYESVMNSQGSSTWPNHFRGSCNIRLGYFDATDTENANPIPEDGHILVAASRPPQENEPQPISVTPLPPNGVDEALCSDFDADTLRSENDIKLALNTQFSTLSHFTNFAVNYYMSMVFAVLFIFCLCMLWSFAPNIDAKYITLNDETKGTDASYGTI